MSGLLLESKNAVIYGGGGAIGGAIAQVFAREGASVFIAGRTQAKLEAVARDIAATGGTVETAQVDVLDQQAVEKHADAIAATAGSIDIALNAVSVMHDQGTLLADLRWRSSCGRLMVFCGRCLSQARLWHGTWVASVLASS